MATFNVKDALRRAKDLERAGRVKSATEFYERIALHLIRHKKYETTKSILERAVSLAPSSPRLYLWLAKAESKLGKLREAKESIASAARAALENREVHSCESILAKCFRHSPDLKQTFYEALLELDRTGAQYFLALARLHLEEQRPEMAQKILVDALKTKTMDIEIVAELGRVLKLRQLPKELEKLVEFERGKLNRENLMALLTIPKEPRKAIAFNPPLAEKSLDELIAELEHEIGIDLDCKYGDVGPLVDEFRRRTDKILGQDTRARMDLALAFREMGLLKDAREELEKVPAHDPAYPFAQIHLGELLIAEGRELAALDTLQKCLRDDRASAEVLGEARYHLLKLYVRLGDQKQAWLQLRELEKKWPDYRDTRTIRNQLEALTEHAPRSRRRA